MAVVSLKYKSKQGTLTAPGDVDPGAMIPIATTTLGSATNTVTFSNIPQTYEHLQIRVNWGFTDTTNNTWLNTRFNSDSGSNYAYHSIRANGSTVSAATTGTSASNLSLGADDVGDANIWSVSIADILDYSNTNKYKTTRALAGQDRNTAGVVNYWSGLWMNTSAINLITIYTTASTFRQNSIFALYGIKRAGA